MGEGTESATADVAVEQLALALTSPHGNRAPIVLIDGRSGAGKTTFASRVATRVASAAIIRFDDIYPGWNGLEAARQMVLDEVLRPLSEGRAAKWRRWNWITDSATEWVSVDPSVPLIIEGVGAISASSRALADLAVWIELDDDARKTRALDRDGDGFAMHWDQWARHESRFIARERPRDHADVIVDGRSITG